MISMAYTVQGGTIPAELIASSLSAGKKITQTLADDFALSLFPTGGQMTVLATEHI